MTDNRKQTQTTGALGRALFIDARSMFASNVARCWLGKEQDGGIYLLLDTWWREAKQKPKTDEELPSFYELMNKHLSKENIRNKWGKVGLRCCHCQHQLSCKKCKGDGKCINCVDHNGNGYKSKGMCITWRKYGYI